MTTRSWFWYGFKNGSARLLQLITSSAVVFFVLLAFAMKSNVKSDDATASNEPSAYPAMMQIPQHNASN